MLNSEIEITGDKAFLEACFKSLEPETEFKTKRANYKMKLGKTLKITIEAQDATAFRAVMTTITGLLSIVEKAWR